MMLHNKKTGEIIESEYMMCVQITSTKGERTLLFENLTQFNNDWEDYTPAEPIIKDEKIRKAVRAWAEACNIPNDAKLDVFEYLGTGKTAIQYTYEAKSKPYKRCVQFEYISSDKVYNSQNDRVRTIAELCGEED